MNEKVAVGLVGMRGGRLGKVLEVMKREAFGGVILAGLGGGIDPTLHVGDVVVEGPETEVELPPFCFRGGGIVGVSEVIGTVPAKEALREASGGRVVEMESLAVRGAFGSVPWGHVRAVSDAAGERLDAALVGLVDEEGRPRAARVAAYLARDPRRVRALMKLKKSCDRALAHLTAVLTKLIAADWPRATECRAVVEDGSSDVDENSKKS